jgi:hypothetical protein
MATESIPYWFDPLTAVVSDGAIAGVDGITIPAPRQLGQYCVPGVGDGQFFSPVGTRHNYSTGEFYICDFGTGYIRKFDAAGNFLIKRLVPGAQLWGAPGVNATAGLVWVADYWNNTIRSYDLNLTPGAVFVDVTFYPHTIEVLPENGNLLIEGLSATTWLYEVREYTPAGVLVATREAGAVLSSRIIQIDASDPTYIYVNRNATGDATRFQRFTRPWVLDGSLVPLGMTWVFNKGLWPPSLDPLTQWNFPYLNGIAYDQGSQRVIVSGDITTFLHSAPRIGPIDRLEAAPLSRAGESLTAIPNPVTSNFRSISVGPQRMAVTDGAGGCHCVDLLYRGTGIGTHINAAVTAGAILKRILFAGDHLCGRRSATQAATCVIEWRVGGAGAWTAVDLDSPATLAQPITGGTIEIRARLNTFSGVDALATDTHGVIDKTPPKVRLGFEYEIAKVMTVFHGPLKMHIDRGSIMGLGS